MRAPFSAASLARAPPRPLEREPACTRHGIGVGDRASAGDPPREPDNERLGDILPAGQLEPLGRRLEQRDAVLAGSSGLALDLPVVPGEATIRLDRGGVGVSVRRRQMSVVTLAAAIDWYRRGLISQGRAAEIAGIPRADFIAALAARKIDVISVDLDELKAEIERA